MALAAQGGQDIGGRGVVEQAADDCIELFNTKDLVFDIVIVLYDVMRPQTFEFAQVLVGRIHQRFPQSRIILLGNKKDLLKEHHVLFEKPRVDCVNTHQRFSCLEFSADLFGEKKHGHGRALMKSIVEMKTIKNVKSIDGAVEVVERFDERKPKPGTLRMVRLENNLRLLGDKPNRLGKKPVEVYLDPKTTVQVVALKHGAALHVSLGDRVMRLVFESENDCQEWKDTILFNINQVFM